MLLHLSAITVLILFFGYLLLTVIVQRAYRAPRIEETGTPGDVGLSYRTASIQSENGKQLFAWYIPPPDRTLHAPAVVAIHGWGANAEMMLPFATVLSRAGYASLLVDARNHGASDADTFSSLPRFAEDLEHAFDWMAQQPEVDPTRIALLGHSVGAGAALLTASRCREVAAVISIAAFAHPREVMRRQMRSHHIPYPLFGWTVMRYVESAIGSSFDRIAPVNTIRQVRCPVLLVHGCADSSVPFSDAEAIYRQRSHQRVELLPLPGADHGSVEHIESHGNELTAFLRRNL
jgi:dipeptidyl aminopeptidase/acylaminoacyl peptidase